MAKLTKKHKIALIIVGGVVGTVLALAAFGFFIYLTIFHPDYGRVYNSYVKYEDDYYSSDVIVDKVDHYEQYSSSYLYIKTPMMNCRYLICGETYQMLVDSDFFDVVTEGAVITIYSHPYIAWDGWDYPLLGVSIGDKVYVDFETGKQNWLDWLKLKSEDYGFLQTPIKEQ